LYNKKLNAFVGVSNYSRQENLPSCPQSEASLASNIMNKRDNNVRSFASFIIYCAFTFCPSWYNVSDFNLWSRLIVQMLMHLATRCHISSIATTRQYDSTENLKEERDVDHLQENCHINALTNFPNVILLMMIKGADPIPLYPCRTLQGIYKDRFRKSKRKCFSYDFLFISLASFSNSVWTLFIRFAIANCFYANIAFHKIDGCLPLYDFHKSYGF